MPAGSSDLILHQYDVSPFSEKARLMLGLKGAQWYSCIHSTIMPKPELIELTGGYRQIPVLQIGADIYCGTELIADELERLFPEPSLTSASGPGLGRAMAYWTDETLFWLAVQVVCASDFAGSTDDDFNRDREEMLPGFYDLDKMRAALPGNVDKLRGQLDLIERILPAGRWAGPCRSQPLSCDRLPEPVPQREREDSVRISRHHGLAGAGRGDRPWHASRHRPRTGAGYRPERRAFGTASIQRRRRSAGRIGRAVPAMGARRAIDRRRAGFVGAAPLRDPAADRKAWRNHRPPAPQRRGFRLIQATCALPGRASPSRGKTAMAGAANSLRLTRYIS